MNTGLFGRHGTYYPSYTNYNLSSYPGIYQKSINAQTAYPSGHLNPNYSSYPSNAVYSTYPYTPNYFYSSWRPIQTFSSYNWNTPEVIVSPRGLESILIAILLLLVLDHAFIRPLKNAH
jgi:hypothetical protein